MFTFLWIVWFLYKFTFNDGTNVKYWEKKYMAICEIFFSTVIFIDIKCGEASKLFFDGLKLTRNFPGEVLK